MNIKLLLLFLCTSCIACSKIDIERLEDIRKGVTDRCVVESLGVEKLRDTVFEPAFIKTYDASGKLTHLKMQTLGFTGELVVFDHDISYSPGKAVLKGSIKVFFRFSDCSDCTEDDPVYIREIEEYRNEKDIEIRLDQNSGLPVEVFQ